ncbi:YeeE/YedE family protein [bacterium]|nr:YeeE/YedE family protein [bacterium]
MERRQEQPRSAPPWSPYLAGGLTGLALTLCAFFADRQFGVTPFYSWLTKCCGLLIYQRGLRAADEFGRLVIKPNWFATFAVGIIVGAALAAWLFNDFKWQGVPDTWRKRFGPSVVKRMVWGFIGGFIALMGVRMAFGCPSGLGLSGMVVLSASGFIGFAAMFLGGVIMASILYPPGCDTRGRGES